MIDMTDCFVRAAAVAAGALVLAGCQTALHPDSSAWREVFARDFSNVTFDTADGWTWTEQGELVARNGGTMLSKAEYENFTLDLAYVMEPAANSGVFLYDTEHPDKKFEVQILDDNHPKYATQKSNQRTGSIYSYYAANPVGSLPPGELNRMTVTCRGPHVKVVVNGVVSADVDFRDWKSRFENPDGSPVRKSKCAERPHVGEIPWRGRIGLQGIHGGGRVFFKYVRIREDAK